MTTYELTKEDYNDLKQLFIYESEVLSLFKDLASYEYSNNALDYNLTLDKIDFYENKVNTYLETLKDDIAMLYAFKDTLQLKNEFEFYGEFNPTINDNYSIKLRLIRLIEDRLIKSFMDDPDLMEEYQEDEEVMEVIDAENGECFEADTTFEEDIFSSSLLDVSITNDVARNYLTILDDYINSDNYSTIKDKLINYKYYLLFRNPDIEKEFRNNDFRNSEYLYESTPLILAKYDLENDYNYLCDTTGFEIFSSAKDNLIESYIQDNLSLYEEIINAISIRIGSIFMANDTYISLKEDILSLDIIDTPILKDSLNSLRKDYSNIRILRFGFKETSN